MTLEDVAPEERYRHAHTSSRVSPPSRGRRTYLPRDRAAAGRSSVPGPVRFPNARTTRPASASSGGIAMRPTKSSPSVASASAHSSSTRSGRSDVDATAGRVAVEAQLEVDPAGVRRAGPPPAPRPPPGRAHRAGRRCPPSARRTPTPRPSAPSCAGSGRSCASELGARALHRRNEPRLPRPYSTLPVRGIRRMRCTRVSVKRITSEAGKNLVTGSNSISPAVAPGGRRGTSSRARTAASDSASSASRGVVIPSTPATPAVRSGLPADD